MNITVVIRAVRDPAGFTVNRKAQKLFVNQERYRLNPADASALEAALRLGDAGHNVTALSYGEAQADDVLRQALAMGAGRAVLVRGGGVAEADAWGLTRLLQRLVERMNPDLVLLGAGVSDADLGQVGPRLATALDWPFIEAAHGVSAGAAQTVEAVVAGAQGYRRLEADLPAVVSVAGDSHQLRFAPAPRIMTVYSTPDAVESVIPDELGMTDGEAAALVRVTGQSFPPERELGTKLEGGTAEAARQLVERLRWK